MALGPELTVGRQRELDHLGLLLEGLDRGEGASVVLTGEAGIGKTRLLADFCALANEENLLVLRGSAAEYERDLPLGVWVDALDSYVASLEPRNRDDWDEALLDDLGRFLPSLASSGGGDEVSDDDRYRVHRAVRALLTLVATERPVLVVLDDLHWSDLASTELIASLLRRPIDAPVLVTLAYRTGMAPEALVSALSVPDLTLLELAPLSAEGSAALVGEAAGSARALSIFEESGGNPFYSLQLAQSDSAPVRSASGDLVADRAGVPALVAAALLEELRALSPEARTLLESASIAGDPFEPELAFAIAGLDATSGVKALDELLDASFLHATSVPRRFAFRHPLVRRAVHESTGGGWRLAAHEKAAYVLANRGASALERARHVEQSAASGDGEAIETLAAAGDASEPRSPESATRWYEAALRLIPASSEAERFVVQEKLAMAQLSSGSLAKARENLLTLLDSAPAREDDGIRLRLLATCAASEHFLGEHEDAQRRLQGALESIGAKSSSAACEVLLALSVGSFFRMDLEPMCDFAERAALAAEELDDEEALLRALCLHAHALSLASRPEEGREVADRAERLLRRPSEGGSKWLESANRLTWANLGLESFEKSESIARDAAAVARRGGQNQFLPVILGSQALSLMMLGEINSANAIVDEALETARISSNDYVTCSVLTACAHVKNAAGDSDSALSCAEESAALVELKEGRRIPMMAAVRLAVLRRELGQPAEPSEHLVSLAGGWDLPLVPSFRFSYLERLSRAELEAGNVDGAAHFIEVADAASEQIGSELGQILAARGRAAVALARGDAADAAQLAKDSATAAEQLGVKVEAARSLAQSGIAAAQAGDRPSAVDSLKSAELVFDVAGAQRDRDEARRQLRKLGARTEGRGRVAAGEGLDSLSVREREVADRVRDRLTNKQIAADLFLSEKTIETHLRNVFFKLDVNSRVEVARAVEQAAA